MGMSRLHRAAVAAVLALACLAGCQTLDDAGQVIDRADLVDDLAARLDRSATLTYSADYRLPDGASATVTQAQQPLRSAYTHPGGTVIVTRSATTRCRIVAKTPVTCTLSAPPAPTTQPGAALFAGAEGRGMVAPSVVTDMLTAAGLDADAVVGQKDTTIAGRHATCVEVSGVDNAAASRFAACVTTEGVLGSFGGTLAGKPVEVTMTGYRDTVEADSFTVPAGATVVDRRPGAR